MQKLSVKLKNTPGNTSLVPCSVSPQLNRDESLSAVDKVLTDNNSKENHSQHKGSSDLRVQNIVYVLNMRGYPLMPTTQQKANKLLKQNKARVVRRKPFTIQLKYATGELKQPITLGIDPGYSNIGFSAVTEKQELISGEVKIRNNISKKMTVRSAYRKLKRSRLWYREPRFNNRSSSRQKGIRRPSIKHKLDSHIRLVDKIKSLLPISKVIVEVANFDIQKIKNPEIEGNEYQQGDQLGFYNIREYVLHRDNHVCQKCKGKSGDKILQVHHLRGKKNGATDRPEELLTVCKTCHAKHHAGIDLILFKKVKDFKPETFMSTIRWRLVNILLAGHTYGYITKYNRIKLGLEKSHSNDAFVIANGNGQERIFQYSIIQSRRNNRRLERLIRGNRYIRRQRYKLQPNDLVRFGNGLWKIITTMGCGRSILVQNIITGIKKYPNPKNVELIRYGKGLCFV